MPADGGPVWAMVLAAGGGSRFGAPKQFLDLRGRTLLERTIDTLAPQCDGIVVALPADTAASGAPPGAPPSGTRGEPGAPSTPGAPDPRRYWGCPVHGVAGGAERADSVRAALAAIPLEADVIVVADAAHPLASATLVRAVIDAVRSGADGAFPGLPLTEVLADVDAAGERLAGLLRVPAPPAATRMLVQTPHAFDAAAFRAAHARSPPRRKTPRSSPRRAAALSRCPENRPTCTSRPRPSWSWRA